MDKQSGGIPKYASGIGVIITDFVSEKLVLGYKYEKGREDLLRFDRFLVKKELNVCSLPRTLVEEWVRKREHESPKTHRDRFRLIRQFAKFMAQRGHDAYIPDTRFEPVAHSDFAPHIFTHRELARLFEAADHLPVSRRTPLRHIVMPELFRLLYGCGLRISEVLKLTQADTDLQQGLLTIRQTKFRKDRLVPMAPELTDRLVQFQQRLGRRPSSAYLFPSLEGRRYTEVRVYKIFRKLLVNAGIPHAGRGKGPRLHDLRHTFAIDRMTKWYQEGADLTNKLPILATYMGH
jgi:integrase